MDNGPGAGDLGLAPQLQSPSSSGGSRTTDRNPTKDHDQSNSTTKKRRRRKVEQTQGPGAAGAQDPGHGPSSSLVTPNSTTTTTDHQHQQQQGFQFGPVGIGSEELKDLTYVWTRVHNAALTVAVTLHGENWEVVSGVLRKLEKSDKEGMFTPGSCAFQYKKILATVGQSPREDETETPLQVARRVLIQQVRRMREESWINLEEEVDYLYDTMDLEKLQSPQPIPSDQLDSIVLNSMYDSEGVDSETETTVAMRKLRIRVLKRKQRKDNAKLLKQQSTQPNPTTNQSSTTPSTSIPSSSCTTTSSSNQNNDTETQAAAESSSESESETETDSSSSISSDSDKRNTIEPQPGDYEHDLKNIVLDELVLDEESVRSALLDLEQSGNMSDGGVVGETESELLHHHPELRTKTYITNLNLNQNETENPAQYLHQNRNPNLNFNSNPNPDQNQTLNMNQTQNSNPNPDQNQALNMNANESLLNTNSNPNLIPNPSSNPDPNPDPNQKPNQNPSSNPNQNSNPIPNQDPIAKQNASRPIPNPSDATTPRKKTDGAVRVGRTKTSTKTEAELNLDQNNSTEPSHDDPAAGQSLESDVGRNTTTSPVPAISSSSIPTTTTTNPVNIISSNTKNLKELVVLLRDYRTSNTTQSTPSTTSSSTSTQQDPAEEKRSLTSDESILLPQHDPSLEDPKSLLLLNLNSSPKSPPAQESDSPPRKPLLLSPPKSPADPSDPPLQPTNTSTSKSPGPAPHSPHSPDPTVSGQTSSKSPDITDLPHVSCTKSSPRDPAQTSPAAPPRDPAHAASKSPPAPRSPATSHLTPRSTHQTSPESPAKLGLLPVPGTPKGTPPSQRDFNPASSAPTSPSRDDPRPVSSSGATAKFPVAPVSPVLTPATTSPAAPTNQTSSKSPIIDPLAKEDPDPTPSTSPTTAADSRDPVPAPPTLSTSAPASPLLTPSTPPAAAKDPGPSTPPAVPPLTPSTPPPGPRDSPPTTNTPRKVLFSSPSTSSTCSTNQDSSRGFRKQMRLVHDRIRSHRNANMFREPVRDGPQAPSYSAVVKWPLDMRSVMRGVEGGEVRTVQHYERQMALMFLNAVVYNPQEHAVHQGARAMARDAWNTIDEYKYAQRLAAEREVVEVKLEPEEEEPTPDEPPTDSEASPRTDTLRINGAEFRIRLPLTAGGKRMKLKSVDQKEESRSSLSPGKKRKTNTSTTGSHHGIDPTTTSTKSGRKQGTGKSSRSGTTTLKATQELILVDETDDMDSLQPASLKRAKKESASSTQSQAPTPKAPPKSHRKKI